MRYFNISSGLRGCYLPDNAGVYAFERRRELKAFLQTEADVLRDAYGYGGAKREVATAAAWLWSGYARHRIAIPFGREKKHYTFALFIEPASKEEYETQENF